MPEHPKVLCHQCDRGGRGNAKDKCACGWQVAEPSDLGCYCGTPITGTPRPAPKLTRSQRRYRAFLSLDGAITFREFLALEVSS